MHRVDDGVEWEGVEGALRDHRAAHAAAHVLAASALLVRVRVSALLQLTLTLTLSELRVRVRFRVRASALLQHGVRAERRLQLAHALRMHHAVDRLLRVEQVVHERLRSLLLGAQVLPDPAKDAPAQPSTRRRRGTVVGRRRRHRSW